MQNQQRKHSYHVYQVQTHRQNKTTALLPFKLIGLRWDVPNLHTLQQTQDTRRRLHIDQDLNQLNVRRLGYLLVDCWDKSDEGQRQGCNGGDSSSEIVVLEEDEQVDETDDPKRYKNGD